MTWTSCGCSAPAPFVLDHFDIDPDETRHPEVAWHALAAVAARRNRMEQQ